MSSRISSSSTQLDQLREALWNTLENNGTLGEVRARVRAEIFHALEQDTAPKPKLPHDNVVINELISEYLSFNGYAHSLSVFRAESGQPPSEQLVRCFSKEEYDVDPKARSGVPAMFRILGRLRRCRTEKTAADNRRSGVSRKRMTESPRRWKTSSMSPRRPTKRG